MRPLISSLRNKTVVITGASRGIGRALALRCARDGANLALLARSETEPSHARLSGSLEDTALAARTLGAANVLTIGLDVRDADAVRGAMGRVGERFGRVDCLVNNASALDVSKQPPLDKARLVLDVNLRGTVNMIAAASPLLQAGQLRHVLTFSPPLRTLDLKWLQPHPVYSASKWGMTLATLGHSDTLRANTLWPKKLIQTAATRMLEAHTGIPAYSQGRTPQPFVDVAHKILCSDATGLSCLDDDLVPVGEEGVDDIFI